MFDDLTNKTKANMFIILLYLFVITSLMCILYLNLCLFVSLSLVYFNVSGFYDVLR